MTFTAPADSGRLVLGRTLPSLLDEACGRCPNPTAFNERGPDGWQPLSNLDFRQQAEELALGLRALGLEPGDRVCLYTHSDISFCLADMACLIAGLVDVPIYLTHAEPAVRHILRESGARALVVSDAALYAKIEPLLAEAPALETVILARADGQAAAKTMDFASLRRLGQRPDLDAATLKARIQPSDLATIIYTSGTTGLPKGVMLSHENLSSNAIAAFSGLKGFKIGPKETAISFLPLTHVFARMLLYGFVHYSTSIYYSDPEKLREHFKEVHPTIFASVPRVLEKAFDRILAAGAALPASKRRLFDWSLDLARRYDAERAPAGLYAVQLKLADRLVFSKWREALGGRIRYVIVGGAALRGELVNIFAAAGVEVLQGYGLTETSPVISYNRAEANRPGTVGQPLPGVEVTLGEDGEILTRGPHVMQGYYNQPEATAEVIDAEGWFHTGDVGSVDEDGHLRITGRIKNLFKLSTGKYVMPQPLEVALEADPLIEHALVIGEGEKFCAALLFLNPEGLLAFAGREGLPEQAPEEIARLPALQEELRRIVSEANRDLPAWSQVKRAALVLGELSVANELLTPTLKLRRPQVLVAYPDCAEALYERARDMRGVTVIELERAPLAA